MSLVGFKISNHPQQVDRHGADDAVDERITPAWLFDAYDASYRFNLDAAASATNAKCDLWFDLSANGLLQSWAPHRVWCNPPYSNVAAWVAKAWGEYRAGCPVIVMLLPANRTEQSWWQKHIEPHRDGRGPIRTEFLPRRINFGAPGNLAGKFNSSPPFGVMTAIWGEHHETVVRMYDVRQRELEL